MENIPIPAIMLHIFLLLVFAKLLGGLFERYKMPKLIGEILAGLIFINLLVFYEPLQTLLSFNDLRPGEEPYTLTFFHILGEIGIIFLLFAVGLETKFSDMMKVGRTASYIAILGVIIPFIGGIAFLFHDLIDFNAALLIGAALFGTSTAVGVECLRHLDAMNTNEARLIISATIIDDILCLALLGVIIGAIKPDATTMSIVINAVIVAAFVLFMFLFISRVKSLAERRKRLHIKLKSIRKKNIEETPEGVDAPAKRMGEFSALGLAVIVCLGLAALSVNIGLAAIIGAFLAGMIFAEFKDTMPVEHNFNAIIYFILPFFFIWVGLEVRFSGEMIPVLPLLGAILVVAVGTKYVAGYLGAKMGKLSKDSAHLIGVSFIPRGEVGIIVAAIGLTSGVFLTEIFNVIILMALITSIMTPPLVASAYRKMEKNRSVAFEDIFIEDRGDMYE
ncbi:MAG: cation:proton antiporter [Methanomassiliicoccaceae archaeon]|jgi:Kef-type K+ transport system membrane component KefB|nr:cation:proton antiporter [Methanomassiliicoccaceae archaeon]